jgi:glycosyltransferase involved in cell wall biosynthesis
MTARPAVWLIVESGTDARLVEGLAALVDLKVLARAIPGGRAVSQPTDVPVTIGTASRIGFAWLVVATLLRASRYDAVLAQGYGLAALAANVAARLKRTPCWMLVCSPIAEYYETRKAAGMRHSGLVVFAIHTLGYLNGLIGRRFIVLSRHLAGVVRRYAPSARVELIPVYGVDLDVFAPKADRAAARAARRLPSSGRIIFSSSRVAAEKDAATLIAAFAALVHEGRDVYLLHRSGGYRELVEVAARAGADARVIAGGDLALDYRASDICVQASRAEGLGFSVLEALACGTPVVASAVGGLVETIRAGETGWPVRPADAAAMAAALREALDHPEEAERRARTGAAMVREQFESTQVFRRLASVLGASAAPAVRG